MGEKELSPFEFVARLLELAGDGARHEVLNAGRGNPNFLSLPPRKAFQKIGDFALSESERNFSHVGHLFGGFPEKEGISNRFEIFCEKHIGDEGVTFLRDALAYARAHLGIGREELLDALVQGYLGCHYPIPPRALPYLDQIIKAYLGEELCHDKSLVEDFEIFPTEGGTASMAYFFRTLETNGLIEPGDTIALSTPIFTPYLEIPGLKELNLNVVQILASEDEGWQIPDSELSKLADPKVKLFCLVNPSNPASVKLSEKTLDGIAQVCKTKNPGLMIVTDDVYGTYADNFTSLFVKCPKNCAAIYSFSKYFGATGWRLGVTAVYPDNIFDDKIKALSAEKKSELHDRYAIMDPNPDALSFIDRMVAESRIIALNHTAGLSSPQQVQMTMFAFQGLMDTDDVYKNSAKGIIRRRFSRLTTNLGITVTPTADDVHYYFVIDLVKVAAQLFDDKFSAWISEKGKTGAFVRPFLERLATETGVALLPARGFSISTPAVRVSLANLTESSYSAIGRFTRQVLGELYEEYKK